MLLLAAFSFWGFVKMLLMVIFVLSALLLMLVVLLQEPKGGGLSSAFGGAGGETFGVQAGSVNKFTSYVAAVFMASALLYAAIRPDDAPLLSRREAQPSEPPAMGAPADPGADAQTPAGGETPPATPPVEKD